MARIGPIWSTGFLLTFCTLLQADVVGTTDDPDIKFVDAECGVLPGSYAVEISAAGERASVTSSVQQTDILATDEILTVNGFDISLSAGMSQQSVVGTINGAFANTGARAEVTPGFFLRVFTEHFGAEREITVESNIVSSSSSSGFGTDLQIDSGRDIEGTIGGQSSTGTGKILAGNGIRIELATDSTNSTLTVAGSQGNVVISTVPEPSSFWALCLFSTGLFSRRFRCTGSVRSASAVS